VEGRVVRRLGPLAVTFGGERHTGWLPRGASKPLDTPSLTVILEIEVVELGPGSYLLQRSPAAGQAYVGPPY
jgi:hypothetical protein